MLRIEKEATIFQNGLHYIWPKRYAVPNQSHDAHHKLAKLQLSQHQSVPIPESKMRPQTN